MESPTTTANASKVQRGTDESPRIIAIEADFAASNLSEALKNGMHVALYCLSCCAAFVARRLLHFSIFFLRLNGFGSIRALAVHLQAA
jgi:hypothetical protein